MWLKGLACGALLTLATPTAVLGSLLLAPAIVAATFDPSTSRRSARPVLVWGCAASARPMLTLWTGGHDLALALGIASDLSVIATAWAAQAAGWLVAELLPLLIAAGLNAAAASRAQRLRESRARHEDEWDIPRAKNA